MASTGKRLCRGSGETVGHPLSFHAAYYASSCAEDLADLLDPLEEVDVVALEPHGQATRMGNDSSPCEIAMFPREHSESDWSDDDDQAIDADKETDCPGDKVADGDDYHDYNPQVIQEDQKTNCPGKDYTRSEAKEIELKSLDRYCEQMGHRSDLCNEIMAHGDVGTRFPPFPLKVLPDVTSLCVLGRSCYHRVYKTHDTSTTASTLGCRRPREMLQVFSMRLSSSELSNPISVYGVLAVRDDLDPRRNYVFNCPRDGAVRIEKQDSFVLPLCSPCRGMYVLEYAILEVDLWVKMEGDGSADTRILSAYVEIEIRSEFDAMVHGRIPTDDCNLDLGFMVLAGGVEAVIEVYAMVDHPRHVRFTASSTAYDDEIVLFDDKFFGNKKLFQHIVAVKSNSNLDVLLRVDQSLFQWTFQDEFVGAVSSPDNSILEYGQFIVRVLFAPKNSK